MAAYLNRTISMVTGNGGGDAGNSSKNTSNTTHNKSLIYDPTAMMSENRTMHINADKSPLQVFVRAKKKINDIYLEIEEYVAETTTFINGKEALKTTP